MIGKQHSSSQYATMIRFTGGGPYDGKSGLFDNDHPNLTIQAQDENGNSFDYCREGPAHFKLKRIWVKHDGPKSPTRVEL